MTHHRRSENPPHGISAFLRKRVTVLVLLPLGVLCSPPTLAWGAMGHEIASQLATPYLSSRTRQELKSLLGSESLARAATWADRMRSNPSRFWQKEAGPYHYVTVPRGGQYDDIGPPPQGDAATALTQFAQDLSNPSATRERKQLALRFAIHIVQDLQQPLHVGNGLDRGGNQVRVQFFGETSNLHSVWDRQIFEHRRRSQSEWISYFKGSGLLRAPTAADADPQLWIAQSAALRESLYPVPARIDKNYIRRELPKAERQLALAGIRTAAWLNAIFDENAPMDNDPRVQSKTQAQSKISWWQRLFRY